MEIKKIIDLRTGEEVEIGGKIQANPELTGNEPTLNGIGINGTNYIVGGSAKLYKHEIDLGVIFTEIGTSYGETIFMYSTNSQMTQESFFEYLYNELTKKKNATNKVSFYGIRDSISKLTITNNYYGGLNIGIMLKVVQMTTTGMNANTAYYNLTTGNMTSWEQVLENVTISSIKTNEL